MKTSFAMLTLLLTLATPSFAQVIAPQNVVVTVDDPDNVALFRLILHSDLTGAPTTMPTEGGVREITVPKPVGVLQGVNTVYTVSLTALIDGVVGADRQKPLLLWIASIGPTGLQSPSFIPTAFVDGDGVLRATTFTIDAPIQAPHNILLATLQP